MPLIHPKHHQFRADCHDRASVYVRRYQPAALRAAAAQSDFQTGHLPASPYGRESPRRTAEQGKTMRCTALSYQAREAKERVASCAKAGRIVQTEANDGHHFLFPVYRQLQAGKDAQHSFQRFSKPFGLGAVWQSPERYQGEAYIDGLESIGRLTRKRSISRERGGDFKTTSSRDIWEKTVTPLRSIRLGKAEEQYAKMSPRSDGTKATASTSARSIRVYKKSFEATLGRLHFKGTLERPSIRRSRSDLLDSGDSALM